MGLVVECRFSRWGLGEERLSIWEEGAEGGRPVEEQFAEERKEDAHKFKNLEKPINHLLSYSCSLDVIFVSKN